MWLRYWQIAYTMQKIPAAQRPAAFGAAMVNPALRELLASAAVNDKNHWNGYGTVTHDIHWGPPVDGENSAVMADCQDQSKFGVFDTTNNTILSYGPSRVNVQATFEKTKAGWKLAKMFSPDGTTC
ncbi:MAG: hypothetical protein ACR2P2_01835 [Nakamurella sp.]